MMKTSKVDGWEHWVAQAESDCHEIQSTLQENYVCFKGVEKAVETSQGKLVD